MPRKHFVLHLKTLYWRICTNASKMTELSFLVWLKVVPWVSAVNTVDSWFLLGIVHLTMEIFDD